MHIDISWDVASQKYDIWMSLKVGYPTSALSCRRRLPQWVAIPNSRQQRH